MDTWQRIIQRIETKKLDSKTWGSDKRNLLKVIDAAHEMDLDPRDIERAPLSNLRTIIKEAKRAIQADDRQKLIELFKSAADLSTYDLRIQIGIREPEELYFDEVLRGGKVYYRLSLTPKQFERLRTSSKPYFVYKETNKHKENS